MNKFLIIISLALLASQQIRCCEVEQSTAVAQNEDSPAQEKPIDINDLSTWITALTVSDKTVPTDEHWKKERARKDMCWQLREALKENHLEEMAKAITLLQNYQPSKSIFPALIKKLNQELEILEGKTMSITAKDETWTPYATFDLKIKNYEKQRTITLNTFNEGERTLTNLQQLLQNEGFEPAMFGLG